MARLEAELLALERRLPLQSLTVDGQRWEWLDTGGAGPCIMMLPGSAADAYMFVRPIVELGQTHRIVAVTAPAHWQPQPLADGLAGVFRELSLPPALVAGSSFGAYWGPFFAQRHPQHVRALLIGNGFVEAGDLAGNPMFDRAALESATPQALHEQMRARIEAAPDSDLRDLQRFMIGRKPPESLHAHFLAVVRAQACPPLALDPQHVLVLDCDDDPVIPPAGRAHVRRHFAPARQLTLATGGHYAHLLNWPAYRQALLELLD